jgi:Mn-containing catalase
MYDVKVQGADPRFGEILLGQFGGATGELSAALTYWTQSLHVQDPAIPTCCTTVVVLNGLLLARLVW